MTEFVKREMAELDKFQQRINQYGLEVNRGCIGGMYEGYGADVFILQMTTKPHPVKGNKKLIERLENDGFYPQVYRRVDPKTGTKYMAFFVSARARIVTTN